MSPTWKQIRRKFYAFLAIVVLGIGVFVAVRNTNAIQDQRRESLLHDCHETNMRYHSSITLLKGIVAAELKATPQKRASIENGYKEFATLISDLDPPENCQALLKAKVKS